MKRDQYWRKPKKAKVKNGAAESWYYVDERGIELHVQPEGTNNHITVRLTRAKLAEYIKRSSL